MAPSLRALASRLGLSLGIVGLVLATASVSAFLSHESARALGQSKRSAERPDLETEAVIRRNVPKAEGFFEIQYTEKDEKGKARRVTAYLHVPEVEKKDDEATGPAEKDAGAGAAERDGDEDGDAGDDAAANAPSAEILVDRLLRAPTELEVGAKIALFGKPVAHDIPGRGGVATGGKDHQIQNAQVVLAGELDEFAIAREHVEERLPGYKWCFVEVEATQGGLAVKYEGASHRVTIAKSAPIIAREKGTRAKIRPRSAVELAASRSERPSPVSSGAAADRAVFEATRIVVLDARYMASAYPLIRGDKR